MPGLSEGSHVFRWKRSELHIAPEGVAWTEGRLFTCEATVHGLLDYASVTGVAAIPKTRRKSDLQIALADEAPGWLIPNVPTTEAEWAADLIRSQVALQERLKQPAFQRAISFNEITAVADSILTTGQRQVVDLVDLVLLQGIFHHASDVHFEPFKEVVRIRFRIDGALLDILELPAALHPRIVTRLKVVSKLTVFRRDLPQEGRIVAETDGRSVDLRVAAIPTLHGEKVSVRIFDPSLGMLGINELGMSDELREQFLYAVSQPQGTILMTGPSNSGKTTTLYAALLYLHETKRNLNNIVTVEDPVEYDLKVVHQTQTNPAIGLTFAQCLRTILRQDPEVIMIGEIRDAETAEIAIRSGLTGHLVLSTVHTRSAAGVFARLMEMGVEPYLVASSVTGVLAERLVRKVCPHCRSTAGCQRCRFTGYSGRTGIFQWLPVDDEVRELILRRATTQETETVMRSAGIRTLREDGRRKVDEEITTVEELQRVGAMDEG